MRGVVYRLGRRRTGSVLLALGAALTLALGSVSSALAKAPVLRVPAHAALVSSIRPPVVSVRPTTKSFPVAHAAGHKIA
jgi:hypothetical protein